MAAPYSTAPMQIHLPEYHRRGGRRTGGGNAAGLPGANFRANDRQRDQAFNQIVQLTADDTAIAPILARIRDEAAVYGRADTPETEQRAAAFLSMYIGYLRNTGGAEEALEVLPELAGERQDDILIQNMALYLLEDLSRYDDMDAIYASLASDNQIPPVNLAQARLFLALAREEYESIEDRYREFVSAGGSAGFLRMVVAQLDQAGKQELSLKLLEDDLQISRSPETLAQLAGVYSGRGEHDKAITLAREAWQAQSASAGRVGPRMGQYNFMQRELTLQSMGLQNLYPLWSAYEQAGRRPELVREFEEKLAGQPNAASLHQILIGLHCQNRRLDLAQQQIEDLVALRPNDFGLRMQYAGLLEANGDKEAALAILEQAAKERPGGRQAYGGEILRLYRDLNKTEALAEFQERLIEEARTPQQMQELAQGFIQQRQYGKAANLLERVVAMEPANGTLLLQVADLYWREEQKEKAVDTYFAFLGTGAMYMNLQSLGRSMIGLVQRADDVGRLDELKKLAADKMAEPTPLRRWPLLSARIAEHEKRWEDAESVVKGMLDGASDDTVHALLAEFAESQGKFDVAIAEVQQIGIGRQAVDNQRLAHLYLKKGDIDHAVDYFKKHAEQQGGFQGHNEGIQSLIRAEAIDAAETYFLEMLETIPTGDWSYRQLVDTVLQEHLQRDRFQPSTIDKIFQTENEHTGAFAQRLTSDYRQHPGGARDRIAPLAERFPANQAIQARYAEILTLTEDYEGALAAYGRIMNTRGNNDHYFNQYVDLLGRAGHRDEQVAAIVARIREEKRPNTSLIHLAVRTLLLSGRGEALASLRNEILENAPEGERPRIDADFVQAGAPGDAHAALLAQYEVSPNERNAREYVQYLNSQGRYDEVAAFYDAHLSDDIAHSLTAEDAGQLAPALIAAGRAEVAWRLLLDAQRRDQNTHNLGNRVNGVVRLMRDYGVSTASLRALLDEIEAKESISLDERLYVAAFEAHLGHGEKALALLDIELNDSRLEEARRAILSDVSPEIRAASMTGNHHSDDEEPDPINVALNAAVQAIGAKKIENAVAILDGITLADDGPADFWVQRARYYMQAGAYDKALVDARVALERAPENDYARVTLALVHAHKGEAEQAVEAWRAATQRQSDSDARTLAGLLAETKFYDAALAVLESVPDARDPDPDTSLLAARILHESGKPDVLLDTMESRYAYLFGNQRYRFEQGFGPFLLSSGLWKKYLMEAANPERPALAAGLLVAAPRASGDERDRIADALSAVEWARIDQAVAYGEVLWRLERRDAATQVLQAALPKASGDRELSSIIRELAAAKAFHEAVEALNTYAERYPALLQDEDWIIRLIASVGDSPEAAPLEERFLATSASDVARRFYSARLALARGEMPKAMEAFDSLMTEPELPSDWLAIMAETFQNNDRPDNAREALERLKNIPGGENVAAAAAVKLISMHLDAGEHMAAVRVFAEMLPARQATVAEARRALLEEATTLPFEEADQFIRQWVTEAPDAAGVSDLLALRERIAERQGRDAPSLDLQAIGVAPDEIYEATLWSHLIAAWRISPPVETNSWADMALPLDADLAALIRGEDGHQSALEGWIANDSLAVYPSVVVSDTPWKDRSNSTSGQSAFALAEIECPNDRTVTLVHGSDDWSRVWVNGEEVLSNAYARVCLVDQDRASVSLRQGRNWVLVKIGNVEGDWEFSLSIVEHGDGLVVIAPSTSEIEP